MYRILIADDSKPIRRVVELSLERDDVELESAADGQTALEIVDAGFFPHLAVVDVHMPRMDGLELCRELKARTPNIAVLLLVGTFEPFEEQEGRNVGASGHLLKPFSADELRDVVHSMLPGDSGLVSEAETIVTSDADLEDSSADDEGTSGGDTTETGPAEVGAAQEGAAEEGTTEENTAEGLASPSGEEPFVDDRAADEEAHQGEEDGDEFLTPLGSSLTILPEESADSTVIPSILTGDLGSESDGIDLDGTDIDGTAQDASAQDATALETTEIEDSASIDQEKGAPEQGGAAAGLTVDWGSTALEETDAVVEPEEPDSIEAEALAEEPVKDTVILSDGVEDSEQDDFEEFSADSDQQSESDRASEDASEEETDEARQPEPATEIDLGDGAPAISLSAEQLDALALRVAGHLGESLFRDGADELFVRVATERVEARIDRLEQELANEEATDDLNADTANPGRGNSDRDLPKTEDLLGESEPNDLNP